MTDTVVGVDVSKEKLDVGVWPEGVAWEVVNEAAGVARLVEELRGREVKLVVVEATGGWRSRWWRRCRVEDWRWRW